jgi:hypothetical protein
LLLLLLGFNVHCLYFSFVMSCFEVGVTICIDLFLNSILLMFCIMISCEIINPFIEHRCDNGTYMLCILSQTLSSGW